MAAAGEVARVYCFQSPSATVDFRPSRFVAIDADLDRKIVAIGAFATRAPAQGPARGPAGAVVHVRP